MAKKYYKLPRLVGVPSVIVLDDSIETLSQALGALKAAGEQPEEITPAEARKLQDFQRREDERKREIDRAGRRIQKRILANPRAK